MSTSDHLKVIGHSGFSDFAERPKFYQRPDIPIIFVGMSLTRWSRGNSEITYHRLVFYCAWIGAFFMLSIACESPPVEEVQAKTVIKLQPKLIEVNSPQDIVSLSDSIVSALLYSNITGLDSLPLDQKKMKFVSALLPAILVAKDRLDHQRRSFKELLTKAEWNEQDSTFFHLLTANYRTSDTTAILSALETHPNSIVLAQAAIESGWGNSRIFGAGNNLFGIWSYNANEPRIPAAIKRDGETIYLRKYADVSESISDYFRTIGRSRHYSGFRKARTMSKEVEKLIPHLINYSERREAYIDQLRTMIRFNQLKQYDHYRLDSSFFVSVIAAEE